MWQDCADCGVRENLPPPPSRPPAAPPPPPGFYPVSVSGPCSLSNGGPHGDGYGLCLRSPNFPHDYGVGEVRHRRSSPGPRILHTARTASGSLSRGAQSCTVTGLPKHPLVVNYFNVQRECRKATLMKGERRWQNEYEYRGATVCRGDGWDNTVVRGEGERGLLVRQPCSRPVAHLPLAC